MEALVLSVFTLLLYVHFRWAMVDPHNPVARPSVLYTAIFSCVVSAAVFAAKGFELSGKSTLSAAVGSFAFAWVVSPSISTPYAPTPEEEPNWWRRWMETRRVAMGGALAKTFVIVVLSWPLEHFFHVRAQYWIAVIMVCFFDIAKTAVALQMTRQRDNLKLVADYRVVFPGRSLLTTAIGGVAALAAWCTIAYPTFSTLPTLSQALIPIVISLFFGFVLNPLSLLTK